MTRHHLLLIPILFVASFVYTQTYYLRFEPECMDRYEFTTDIDPTPYVVYSSHTAAGGLIQLDIGKEPIKWERNLPDQLNSCSSFNFNKGMANAINDGSVKMYIVRVSPTHYNIAPVEKATYILSDDRSLNITMSDADFTMEWRKMVSNQNLSSPTSPKAVYLEGTIKYNCLTGYIFKKKDDHQSDSFKEYTILPEAGIINKRSAPYEGAVTNSLKLERIGDLSMNDFIKGICAGGELAYEDIQVEKAAVPDTYDATEVVAKRPVEIPASYASNAGPCPSPTRSGVHVVQKGETLYSISKRYGVSVDQLKNWNGIGKDNLINPCQELSVAESRPSDTLTPKGGSSTNKKTAQDYHIVRPNETVAQLATMYGFTEERFRQMNALGPYDRIYAGQKLFTSDCDCPNTEGVGQNTPLPYEQAIEPKLTEKGNPDVFFRPIKVHEVKAGESLFAIAKQYDTSVDRIQELNGLDKGASLKNGQRIYVQ